MMARNPTTYSSKVALLVTVLLFLTLFGQSYGQLKLGYYNGKCKKNNVEKVVFHIVKAAYDRDRSIPAALLRMQFHDCFVRGCDASILLDGINTEKTSLADASIRGYEVIDACKASLERKCPGVVSCADIIVIAARVSVFLTGGRWYSVEVGRRDGFISRAAEAEATLPGANIPVPIAVQEFAKRGLTTEDFVLLLGGGHSIGVLHCSFYLDRLYNFQGTGRPDPTMNRLTLAKLRRICPRSGSNNYAFADQTPGSANKMDNDYFKAIRHGKGLLQIDQQIALHPLTRNIVARLSRTGEFYYTFGRAMVNFGRVGVLTGKQGQIRRSCRSIN